MADWLEEIEQHRARRERDQILYGGYNPQRDKDEEALIAEVKRLRWAKWELTNNYAELQTEVKRLREENTALRKDKERIEFENNQFRRYVIEVGCSYTQTESDCECDYEYPWPCDHCPIVEHNRTIDAEMDSEWEIEFIR